MENIDSNYIPLYLVPIVALGFATTQLSWSLFNLIVPVILKDEYGISLAWVGFIMTWDNILAFFIQPTVGTYSDRVRTRFGRRLPFIIPGVIFGSFFFFILSISSRHFIGLFLLNIVIFNIIMALYRAPSASLMPDLVKSEDRSIANGIGNFTGGLAAGIALFVSAMFLRDGKVMQAFALISISMIIALLILVIFIREPDIYKTNATPITTIDDESGKTVKDDVYKKNIKTLVHDLYLELKFSYKSTDKSLIYMILAITFWFMGVNSIEAFYSTYVWNLFMPDADSEVAAGEAGNVIFVFPIVFVTFAVIGGILGKRIGRIKTSKIGAIIMLFGVIFAANVEQNSTFGLPISWQTGFRLSFVFAGSGWGLVTVNSIVVVWEHTLDNGLGTGLYYAFTSAAAVLGPSFAGLVMSKFGLGSLFYYSAIFFIIALFFIFLVITGEAGDKVKINESRWNISPS